MVSIKFKNDEQYLLWLVLIQRGRASAAELAEVTGLPPATAWRTLGDLLDRGTIRALKNGQVALKHKIHLELQEVAGSVAMMRRKLGVDPTGALLIRDLRQDGVSDTTLAKKLCVHASTIRKWVAGTSTPTLKQRRLAELVLRGYPLR